MEPLGDLFRHRKIGFHTVVQARGLYHFRVEPTGLVANNPLQQLYRLGLYALLVVLLGVIGYRFTADLGWLDSLYMTVITLSTVGFREVGPGLDADAKLFTVFLILGGAGVLAYAIKMTTEVLLDDSTRHYFHQRATLRRLGKMKDHYIVCGYGRVGRAVCTELATEEIPFVVVEMHDEQVRELAERGWSVIQGDATEDHVLEQAGIERARGLMACIDSDANNLMLIFTAKAIKDDLNMSARVGHDRNISKFKRAGASNIYSPYSLVGRRLARSLTQPGVTEVLDLALEASNYDLTIAEFPIPEGSELEGKTLVESNFRARFGAVILSIIRQDDPIVHNPPADTTLRFGDRLILLGSPDQLVALQKLKGPTSKATPRRRQGD